MLAKSLLLVLAAHFILAAIESERPTAEEASEKCRIQHNFTQEEVKRLNEMKYLETKDDNIKCFVKCFLSEMYLMNEEGEITPEGSDWKSPDAENLAACANVTGTDSCDKALNFSNCLHMKYEKQQKSEE